MFWVQLWLPFIFWQLKIDTKHQEKSDKVCFGEAMVSSLSFWLRYCYLAKMVAYIFIQYFLSMITTITVGLLLHSATHK